MDKVLPFGLCSAPKVFTALADALEWVIREQGIKWCIHYIDDFLTAGPQTLTSAKSSSHSRQYVLTWDSH